MEFVRRRHRAIGLRRRPHAWIASTTPISRRKPRSHSRAVLRRELKTGEQIPIDTVAAELGVAGRRA